MIHLVHDFRSDTLYFIFQHLFNQQIIQLDDVRTFVIFLVFELEIFQQNNNMKSNLVTTIS